MTSLGVGIGSTQTRTDTYSLRLGSGRWSGPAGVGFFVFLIISVSACSNPPSEPERIKAEELQQALDTEFDRHSGVGVTAAVLIPGQAAWVGSAGVSHPGAAIDADMAFGVGSVTKTIVAAVTLQLVDEGMLDLEDPIDLWLPSLANIDGAVTIRQLLNHTSGLYSFTEHPDRNDSIIADIDRVWTPDETLRAFVLPPYQAPGVAFRYSNTNYVLLGMVIEEVTGSRFSAELRSRILDPLGLSRTYLAVEEVVSQPVAHMWFDWDGDGSEDDMSQYSMNSLFSMDWTAGALFSTAEDLVRFSQALFEGDLVEASSLAAMLDFYPVGGELGYGLGISITDDFVPGIQGVGHDGVIAGYSARLVITQSPPVYISVLQNHDDFDCKAAISRALWEVATGF